MRTLIVYASVTGQTAKIVDYVADRLRAEGQTVEVFDTHHKTSDPDPASYEMVIVAAPIRMGAYASSVLRFVRRHRAALSSVPTAFLAVSMAAAYTADNQAVAAELDKRVATFIDKTGWTPGRVEHVAGVLAYTRYGFLTRWIMKRIAASQGGNTDTTQDHEYTDWTALGRFVDSLVPEQEAEPARLAA